MDSDSHTYIKMDIYTPRSESEDLTPSLKDKLYHFYIKWKTKLLYPSTK